METNMLSLRASGLARLIFYPDQDRRLEGVLICEDTEETLGIVGRMSKDGNTNLVDINVTDGETGEVYVVRRVELITTNHGGNEKKLITKNEKFSLRKMSGSFPGTGIKPGSAPTYELRSDVIRFSTKDILVGRKADKEMAMYLSPDLIGKRMAVHVGPMEMRLNPTSTQTAQYQNEKRPWHFLSLCGGGHGNAGNVEKEANANFLM